MQRPRRYPERNPGWKWRACALLFAGLYGTPEYAFPQEEENTSEPLMESVVVTATRMERSLYDVSEAVTVIGEEQIDRQGPELIAEMLRGLPGTWFQQTTPGQGIPIIRGLKGSQVLHLVDGIRLNNAFFRDAPNQYLGLVDTYAVRRTEVIRGSAPSLYGADAMGGVVQMLTREPMLQGGAMTTSGRVYTGYETADSSLVTRIEAAAGHEGMVLSGGATYQDHGDRRVGGGQKVRPSGYRSRAADMSWRQDLGEHSEILLSAQYLEQPSTPRVDELVPGYGQENPSSERYEFKPNRRDFLHARYRYYGGKGWFERFEAHLARQVIRDDRLARDFQAPDSVREFNESTMDALTLQFNSPWGDGPGGSELVWGLERYQDTVRSSRFIIGQSGVESRSNARFPDGSSMDSTAVYASNRWEWGRLTLDTGLRYSRFEIHLAPTSETGPALLTPSDLTGDIHVGYEISHGLRLLANVGRGFRPPNIFDLGTLGSRPGNRFNVPNPNLRPESVWSYDLGFKLENGDWQGEAFVWYADYRDKIASRFTGAITPEGRLVVESENLSEARLYGIEAGLRYRASDALSVYAVVNVTQGTEIGPQGGHTPADRVPPLNSRLGLVWEPSGRCRIEPYLDLAGRQDRLSPRDEEDPRIDPAGTAGWSTVNLLLSWRGNERFEAGLRLRNLTDRNYREHGSGIDASGRGLGVWLNVGF